MNIKYILNFYNAKFACILITIYIIFNVQCINLISILTISIIMKFILFPSNIILGVSIFFFIIIYVLLFIIIKYIYANIFQELPSVD